MLSSFTTTVRSEIDLNHDSEGYRKAKAAFEQQHAPFDEAVRQFEAVELPKRLAAWEHANKLDAFAWEVREPHEMKSEEDATAAPQPKGWDLGTGQKGTSYTYT